MAPLKSVAATLQACGKTGTLDLYLTYVTCFLIILFPWVNPGLRHGGSTIYAILILGGLALGWRHWPKLGFEERTVLFACVALLGVVSLTLVNTDDLDRGFKHIGRYLRIAGILPIYLLLRGCGASFLSRGFIAGCIIAGPILAIQAWYQTEIQGVELARGAYHHIVFGDLAALAVGILIAALITLGREWWHYVLGLASISAGIMASLLSGARNSWLFLASLTLVLPWLYRRELGTRRLACIAGGVIILIAAVAIWQPPLLADRLEDGIEDLETFWQDPSRDTPWGARVALWRNSLVIFSNSPLLGTGIGDFRQDNLKVADESFSYMATRRFSHAHSVYFHALAEMGIVGFAALVLSLFILPLRYFYRRWSEAPSPDDRFCALAGLLSVFAFAVFGIGEVWLVRNAPVNAYVISVAVFMAGLAEWQSKESG